MATSSPTTPARIPLPSTRPAALPAPDLGSERNQLAQDVSITGRVCFVGTLTIDGQLEGETQSGCTLLVGERARLKGGITVQDAIWASKISRASVPSTRTPVTKMLISLPLCARRVSAHLLCSVLALAGLSSARAVSNLTQYVDLTLGVQTGPNDYLGAQVPFGSVDWSPINRTGGTPYDERSKTINWFALSAMTGGGLAEVPHMVSVNACANAPGTTNPYSSAITGEVTAPGYYKVHLTSPNVDVEVAAATHSGISRMTFPASTDSCVVFDPEAYGGAGGTITIDPVNKQVTGTTVHNDWGRNPHTAYFVATFDTPFSASGTWTDGQGFVKFDTTSHPVVMMKVAVSYVSGDNAKLNLNTEIPAWDFTGTKTSADTAWNTLLNSIEYVSGATLDRLQMFYTALYRSCQDPKVFSDVDGRYLGFDGAIHTAAAGHKVYSEFPGWDTYRTLPQLLAIIAPDVASDIERTLVLNGQQNGGKLPKWGWANNDVGWGTGAPACAYIGSAYAFGATNIDLAATKTALLDYGMDTSLTWPSLGQHMDGGGQDGSQANEMESGNADMGVATICQAADDEFHYSYFRNRAQNIFSLWDPNLASTDLGDSGYFSGTCLETRKEEQVWCSPVNYAGLIARIGGNSAATAKLDRHTSQLIPYNEQAYFNPVNQPGIHVPYAYNWMQAPSKAQALIRKLMTDSYVDNVLWVAGLPQVSPAPSGWEPNDDSGSMSAWYVYMNLGLYPAIPGVGGFTVTAPLFSYVIHLKNGSNISVTANNASIGNQYVQSMAINGVSNTSLWIPWASLSTGANLVFNLGSTASTWGTGTADAPPSLGPVPAEANYALTAAVSASSDDGTNLPSYAVDGLMHTPAGAASKWQSTPANFGDKWLQLDLGAAYNIDDWIVMHAGEAGERASCNTKDFELQKSADGTTWTNVDAVTGNTANITDRAVTPFSARYVRLYITTATQTTDTTARIYEFQVFGKTTPVPVSKPVITSASSTTGTVGKAFSYQITASNSPTGFSATGLPNGLSVNTTSGLISGTPMSAGTSSVSLGASNAGGTATQNLALTIILPTPVISSATTATGTAGTAFSYTVAASNAPTSFSATGLPFGLSVNAATGVITGTPTDAGTFHIALGATNAGGTGTATLTLTINPGVVSFNSWEAKYFNSTQLGSPATSGPTATPQGDGVTNLLKYLCDINPSRPMTPADRAALPTEGTTADSKYLTLTYRQYLNATGVTVTLENSIDLNVWTTVSGTNPTVVGTDAATGDPIVRLEAPLTPPRQFLRLHVAAGQ